jgi:hypothetical protein
MLGIATVQVSAGSNEALAQLAIKPGEVTSLSYRFWGAWSIRLGPNVVSLSTICHNVLLFFDMSLSPMIHGSPEENEAVTESTLVIRGLPRLASRVPTDFDSTRIENDVSSLGRLLLLNVADLPDIVARPGRYAGCA